MRENSRKLKAVREARAILSGALKRCSICPRRCGADRASGKTGYCRAKMNPSVYSFAPHYGEEPPLSGEAGSGTIFFSRCNMKCVYCQNYYFSQLDNGEEVSTEKLSKMMLGLQELGCHNINLVSPTHYISQILSALEEAYVGGLDLPIVYNTSGYDLLEIIKLLNGIVDIYLPDMRYSDDKMAKIYSDAPDYVANNRECVKEMYRQAGELSLDAEGVARKGMIIRLLVMPDGVSGTGDTLRHIKDNISKDVYLSIMNQYYPTFKAYEHKPIARRITADEYRNVVDEAAKLGLNNVWIQEMPEEIDPKFLGTNIKPRTEI